MSLFSKQIEKNRKERIEHLEKEIESLNSKIQFLKSQESEYKRKIDDIEHTVKMREEALELDFKKKEMELNAKHSENIAEVKDKYRDKMESQLGQERDNIKEMYTQILQRLPNANMTFKQVNKDV